MLLAGEGGGEKEKRDWEREGEREELGEEPQFYSHPWNDSGRSTPTALSNLHGHRLNIPPPFLSPFPPHFSPDKGESPATVLGPLVT